MKLQISSSSCNRLLNVRLSPREPRSTQRRPRHHGRPRRRQTALRRQATAWWRDAVVYQVYVRSFADANGDGIGDLAGVLDRLPYLRDLGVDALWFSPWYPSPMADTGYDISDYRSIDPAFGTLAEAEQPDRRGARARDPHDRRHRPEPRLEPASRGSARRSPRRPARRSGRASGSGPARARTASCRRTAGSRSSAAPPGRGRTDEDGDARRVVPPPVRARAARPQLDAPGRVAPSTRTSCASGSTAASPACGSTRPPCS